MPTVKLQLPFIFGFACKDHSENHQWKQSFRWPSPFIPPSIWGYLFHLDGAPKHRGALIASTSETLALSVIFYPFTRSGLSSTNCAQLDLLLF